tara:strand:- start:1781 stop:2293 length:513 start_codon:yes stop_codon:yes gene_type:complete
MFKYLVFFIYLFFSLYANSAEKNTAKVLGTYGDWKAFYWNLDEDKVCSILSYPKKEEGKYTKRGKVIARVTQRVENPSAGVVSFQVGYPIKEGSDIKIKIDGKPFGVFNFLQDQIAWTSDPEFDGMLIKAMQRGTTMIIKGVSSRGTNTKDTYSLRGFTAAYKAISKVCK